MKGDPATGSLLVAAVPPTAPIENGLIPHAPFEVVLHGAGTQGTTSLCSSCLEPSEGLLGLRPVKAGPGWYLAVSMMDDSGAPEATAGGPGPSEAGQLQTALRPGALPGRSRDHKLFS